MEFIVAAEEQDEIILAHYLAIWKSYGTPPNLFAKTLNTSSGRF